MLGRLHFLRPQCLPPIECMELYCYGKDTIQASSLTKTQFSLLLSPLPASQSMLCQGFILDFCTGVKVYSSSVFTFSRVCNKYALSAWWPLWSAVLPAPAPNPPHPWQEADLGRAWQRAGLEGAPQRFTPAHWANPLSQPTQSVQVCSRLDKQTHMHTSTHTHAATNTTRLVKTPWAGRCPNTSFLCYCPSGILR